MRSFGPSNKFHRMKFVRNSFERLLSIPSGDRPWHSVILWWELRRIAYNIAMLVCGLIGLTLFVLIDQLPPQLPFEQRDWEPLSVLVFAFLANVAYTGGWIAELTTRVLMRKTSNKFGPMAFSAGSLFSIILCFAPAVINGVWWVLRALR
jgi:hypothetical protein